MIKELGIQEISECLKLMLPDCEIVPLNATCTWTYTNMKTILAVCSIKTDINDEQKLKDALDDVGAFQDFLGEKGTTYDITYELVGRNEEKASYCWKGKIAYYWSE